MEGYNLSLVCAYIDDFINEIKEKQEKFNLQIYVEDRFNKKTKQKKIEIYYILNKFLSNIKLNNIENIETKNLAKDLLKIL